MQNRIIMFCLELWYSVEKYRAKCCAVQLLAWGIREQHISKWNYHMFSSTVQEIQISRLELQRWSLEIFLSFLKYIFGSWEWDLANSFRVHVIQISTRQMNVHYIFFQLWKVKIFVEIFTHYNQILIFEEHLCKSNMDFYIWYWPDPN